MAGNFRASAGVETPSQGRTAVQGSYVPVRQASVQQVPAGYQLAYQVGGPRYMYGETPLYGAYYRDGGIVPGQIYGNMRGSREGADMFGFWPTMFQSQPYATASQMYTPGLGVMPLIGYPSKYPHVVMGGYSDYGAGIANQAMGMMLPLLMMGLYRQMFPPMMPQAPAQGARAGGGGGKSGGGSSSGGASAGTPASTPSATPETPSGAYNYLYPNWALGDAYDPVSQTGGGVGMGTMGPHIPFITDSRGNLDTARSASPALLQQYYNHTYDNPALVGPVRGPNDHPDKPENYDRLVRMKGYSNPSALIALDAEPTSVHGASDAPIPLQPLR